LEGVTLLESRPSRKEQAMSRWSLEEKLVSVGRPIAKRGGPIDVLRRDHGVLLVLLEGQTLRGRWGTAPSGEIWMDAATESDELSTTYGCRAVETATQLFFFLDRFARSGSHAGDIRDTETWTATKPPGEEPPDSK
jgi:hypothetical protein